MSVALDQARRHSPSAELSPVAWIVDHDVAYEEWLRHGSRLGLAGRGAAWWVGDWVHYGTERYGSKYTIAARVTGYDRQTLMNMVYVAGRFKISRRREKLSFSHHAEVAPLTLDEQERWLDRAIADHLSVHDLREALVLVKRVPGHPRTGRALKRTSTRSRLRDQSAVENTTQRIVVCPHCGERFTP